MNLTPRVVQLENGWVAQVVLFSGDPMVRGTHSQPAPEVVWESDDAWSEQETALKVAEEALVDAARQLFKGVQR